MAGSRIKGITVEIDGFAFHVAFLFSYSGEIMTCSGPGEGAG